MIITVTNRKGGTGKSTTVVNLAAAFAANGSSVLVIDLDTQGHSGAWLNVEPADKQFCVHTIFELPDSKLNPLTCGVTGIDVCPADRLFEWRGEQALTRLQSSLHQCLAEKTYDYVLIDTPPTLDPLLLNGLMAADKVLVPFLPHPMAAAGVGQLTQLFYRLMKEQGKSLSLLGLLPVMEDSRLLVQKQVMSEIKSRYGNNHILRGIRQDVKVVEAFSHKTPVVKFAPRCRATMDYTLLANYISAA